jgi:hypothetical protein
LKAPSRIILNRRVAAMRNVSPALKGQEAQMTNGMVQLSNWGCCGGGEGAAVPGGQQAG